MSQTRNKIITDDKLFAFLQGRGKHVLKGRELSKRMEDDEQELKKLALQVQKIDEKAQKQMKEHDLELGKYEAIKGVELKNKTVIVTIYDRLKDYEAMLNKQGEEEKKETTKK